MCPIGSLLLCAVFAQIDPDAYKPQVVDPLKPAASETEKGTADVPPAKTDGRQEQGATEPDLGGSAATRRSNEPNERLEIEQPPLRTDSTPGQTPPAGLGTVAAGRVKLRPPEILAEALSLAEQGDLKGRPLTLSEALGRTPDRATKIGIAQAYWKLAGAQANYYFARDQRNRLRAITEDQQDQAAVSSARAAARAAIREAELEVIDAQSEVGQRVGMPGNDAPLAVDRPHVGAYETKFDVIYSSRSAPARNRLIDRSLPVCRKAIDLHAAAVVAGLDAYEATAEEYRGARVELSTVLALLSRLTRERRAFVDCVLRDNRDIAEYALSVPGSMHVADAKLASLLITEPARPAASKVQQAGGSIQQPETQPPTGDGQPKTFKQPKSSGDGAPRTPTPAEGTGTDAPDKTTAFRPEDELNVTSEDVGLYQGLIGVEPAARAQKLAGLLHWDRSLPEGSGEPLPLEKVLSGSSSDRRQVLRAYWQAREVVAAYQATAEREEQLKALSLVAVKLREQPGGAAAMLRLHAARQAARGDAFDARLAILDGEFRLASLLGLSAERAWPLPSTAPMADAYTKAGSADQQSSPESRRILTAYELVKDRSETVVMADRARAIATADAGKGWRQLDEATTWAGNQATHTLALLSALTVYNVAIADAVASRLPVGASSREMMEALGLPVEKMASAQARPM